MSKHPKTGTLQKAGIPTLTIFPISGQGGLGRPAEQNGSRPAPAGGLHNTSSWRNPYLRSRILWPLPVRF